MNSTIQRTDLRLPASPLSLTDAAVVAAHELMRDSDNRDLALRISVHGGGCSGFRYDFSFDRTKGADDTLFEQGGVKFLVDAGSASHLAGAHIDYQESEQGRGFVIHNPNATTCSCGSPEAA